MKKYYFIYAMFMLLGLFSRAQSATNNSSNEFNTQKKVRYTVKKYGISSDQYTDFGTYVGNGKLFFLSDRKSWPVSWKNEDQQPFLDLFFVDLKADEYVQFAGAKKNGRLNEGPICFSKDGSRVYYTRDYGKKGEQGEDGKIHLALYTAKVEGDKWVNEIPLRVNDVNYSVGHPALSNDGKYLYFCSNKPEGKGGADIYRALVHEDGNVGEAELLPGEVNTSGDELFPSIGSNDEMYFSSTGHGGMGGLDVFMALFKRDHYIRITNVGYPVNSASDDFAYASVGRDTGFFSSNRDGNDDIYSYNQIIPFRFVPMVSGVIALENNDLKEGITVELLDMNENLISSQLTTKKGQYSFDLEEEKQYTVRYSKEGYDPYIVKVSTKGNGFGLSNDVVLKKDNGVVISLQLIASRTGLAVEGALVEIMDNIKNEVFISQLSGPEGSVAGSMLKLEEGDSLDLSIKVAKEGYLTKEVHFQYTLTTMQDIALEDFFGNTLKMNRTSIAIGDKIEDFIDIQPVHFEPDEYEITGEVSKELNKVIAFMKENNAIHVLLKLHTDSRGDASSNLSLSSKRAKACVEYFRTRGIESNRVSGKGYGEKEILNHCRDGVDCSEQEHLENQRIEFVITRD